MWEVISCFILKLLLQLLLIRVHYVWMCYQSFSLLVIQDSFLELSQSHFASDAIWSMMTHWWGFSVLYKLFPKFTILMRMSKSRRIRLSWVPLFRWEFLLRGISLRWSFLGFPPSKVKSSWGSICYIWGEPLGNSWSRNLISCDGFYS